MVEPDLDQALCHRERDETLRRLPGNAHGGRYFVLGATGDVIEPASPRRIIQPSLGVRPFCHGRNLLLQFAAIFSECLSNGWQTCFQRVP
ncbi:hypothetical protein D3C87_1914500 [compost metagenome]